jgi:hypothetical protein
MLRRARICESANECLRPAPWPAFAWPPGRFAPYGLAIVLCLILTAGCTLTMNHGSTPWRDINAVLTDHDKQLLALPGVVGVYVGLWSDEKTPCLKVMLARKDADLERRIPRTLEGHPVMTEVTGEIHPMK